MSTYKSIAGVTQSLVNLLGDRMSETATITVAPPDVEVDQVSGPRLNLYLYHLAENGYLKNQEIPGEGYPGAYGSPPLSLDLNYIVTAFGSSDTGADADMQAQFVLGDAMRVLHDTAIISPDLMQVKSPGKTILDTSLLDAFEQVKVTLQPKALEEITKIWTALPNVNFRRSVIYEVCVVQLQSQQPRQQALQVRQRRVYAMPMQSPQIQQIFVQPPPQGLTTAAAEEGETLRLLGFNFNAPNTAVEMDQVPGNIASLQPGLIDVVIPTGQLNAGLHGLRVVQGVSVTVGHGQPPEQIAAFSSNSVAFQLIPKITGAASSLAGGIVSVPVQPAVVWTQAAELLLGDFVVPEVPPAPGSPAATAVQFQLPQPPATPIPTGSYLMRIRVDGAESRLQIDNNPASPTYLQYVGPTYAVP
jgi:Pvc16 N-terminal domain